MVCCVKLTGRLLVWKKRTVIASPSFCSPTCNREWITFDRARAFRMCVEICGAVKSTLARVDLLSMDLNEDGTLKPPTTR